MPNMGYLQHVLPKGFHKVRYYGLWNPRRRDLMQQVRLMLQLRRPVQDAAVDIGEQPLKGPVPFQPFRPVCPSCGCSELVHVREIPRPRSRGP